MLICSARCSGLDLGKHQRTGTFVNASPTTHFYQSRSNRWMFNVMHRELDATPMDFSHSSQQELCAWFPVQSAGCNIYILNVRRPYNAREKKKQPSCQQDFCPPSQLSLNHSLRFTDKHWHKITKCLCGLSSSLIISTGGNTRSLSIIYAMWVLQPDNQPHVSHAVSLWKN